MLHNRSSPKFFTFYSHETSRDHTLFGVLMADSWRVKRRRKRRKRTGKVGR